MNGLRWLLTAAAAAYACQLVVHHPTPIDAALPLIAVIVTVVAAASYPSLMVAVPLLVIAEIAVPDEGMRLLAFGAIVAAVFAFALLARTKLPSSAFGTFSPHEGRRRANGDWDANKPSPLVRGEKVPKADEGSVFLTVAAILLLRWIPFADVRIGREVFLLLIAVAIVFVLDRTPFAIALAVIVALITPAVPMRTLLLPMATLCIAVLAKIFGMPKLNLRWPSMMAMTFVLLFFAWSGVVARAFPYFLKRVTMERPRAPGADALPAGASVTLPVPEGKTSLILSGANVAMLPRNTALGTIEPGARVVRIGDAADWGYLRREHFYGSRNPLPRDPAGRLRGYGYSAWLDGAGRVPLPPRARVVRITADASLPRGASLQVEGFE